MAWAERMYLQLVIKWSIEIDMTHYPMWHIIPLRLVDKQHAMRVVEGWTNGAIKWVRLSETNLEACKNELAKIPVATGNRKRDEHSEVDTT